MDEKIGNLLANTMESIFANNTTMVDRAVQARNKKRGPSKRDLEVALTVLLVDLASCDQNFAMPEYHTITNGLKRMFGTNRHEVQGLINQAQVTLRSLRGTSSFAALLRENLSEKDRIGIMEVIEDIINADGVEDGFETYLRNRLAGMLGVPVSSGKPTT